MNNISMESSENLMPAMASAGVPADVPAQTPKSRMVHRLLLWIAVLLLVGFACSAYLMANDVEVALGALYDSVIARF